MLIVLPETIRRKRKERGCGKTLFSWMSQLWIHFSPFSIQIKDAVVPSALTLTFPQQLDKFTEEKPRENTKGKGTSRCHQQRPGLQAAGIWQSIALCSLGFYAATLANSRSDKSLLGQQLLSWPTTLAWSSVATCTFQRIFNYCGHWPALGKLSREEGPYPSP